MRQTPEAGALTVVDALSELPRRRGGLRLVLPVRRFAERRAVVLGTAAVVMVAVFAWRESVSDRAQGIDLLYVVPVALVALELGLAAGLACASLAVALVGVWVLGSDGDAGLVRMLTRVVAIVAVGAVAGRFSDHMRATQLRQRMLLESGLGLAHLSGAEDLPVALAGDARRLLAARGVRVELSGRVVQLGSMSGPVEQVPIEVRGARFGTLSVATARAVGPEDRVTLAILALQAAIAEENRRLLEQELERAAMRAELRDARLGLERRGHQVQELLTRQEQERSHVAHELHENAAQMLAAVLLGLAALEREVGSGPPTPTLGTLRSTVDATLRSLRALASTLRPPALALGLPAALEGLASGARGEACEAMTVVLEDTDGLGADVETMIYRAVEEALAAVGGACSVSISKRDGGEAVEIVVAAASPHVDIEHLTVLGARLDLMNGSLSVDGQVMRLLIPLGPLADPGAGGRTPAPAGARSAI